MKLLNRAGLGKTLIFIILSFSTLNSCNKNKSYSFETEITKFLKNDFSFNEFKCKVTDPINPFEPEFFIDYAHYTKIEDIYYHLTGCMGMRENPEKPPPIFEAGEEYNYFIPAKKYAEIKLNEFNYIDSWSFVNHEKNALLLVLSKVYESDLRYWIEGSFLSNRTSRYYRCLFVFDKKTKQLLHILRFYDDAYEHRGNHLIMGYCGDQDFRMAVQMGKIFHYEDK